MRGDVRVDVPAASTKSAPQRSGDGRLDGGAHHGFGASTKSAPQRSGDARRVEELVHDLPASTKSAPQRSGDTGPARRRGARAGLNEVRSPKERRRDLSGGVGAEADLPQRSPLPKGAETPAPKTWWLPCRSGLNEVRSPKERRLEHISDGV